MEIGFIKTLITIALACLGWLIVNYLTTQREVRAKKRELVTKYQIETFSAVNTFFTYLLTKRSPPSNVRTDFNKAVSMIQLLGSQSQINNFSNILIKLQEITSSKSGHLKGKEVDILLQDLRDELRKELQLKPVNNKVISMLSFDN